MHLDINHLAVNDVIDAQAAYLRAQSARYFLLLEIRLMTLP